MGPTLKQKVIPVNIEITLNQVTKPIISWKIPQTKRMATTTRKASVKDSSATAGEDSVGKSGAVPQLTNLLVKLLEFKLKSISQCGDGFGDSYTYSGEPSSKSLGLGELRQPE